MKIICNETINQPLPPYPCLAQDTRDGQVVLALKTGPQGDDAECLTLSHGELNGFKFPTGRFIKPRLRHLVPYSGSVTLSNDH